MITIKQVPPPVSPAHSPGFFVVTSDNVGQPNFKYVFDIVVAGQKVATLKPSPEPATNLGVIDPNEIVRAYLRSTYFKGITQVGSAELSYLIMAAEAEGNLTLNYEIRVGEEYGAPPTTYTNLVSYPSARVYNMYEGFNERNSLDLYQNIRSNYVSNKPPVERLNINDSAFTFYYTPDAFTNHFEVKKYSAAGVLLGNHTASLGALADAFYQVGYGPYNINEGFKQDYGHAVNFIDSAVAYYTFEMWTEGRSKRKITVSLDEYRKFTHHALVFLNQLGGYDTVFFKGKSERRATIERKSYGTKAYQGAYDGTTYNYISHNRPDAERVALGNTQVYSVKSGQRFKLTTADYPSDAGFKWLYELILSPLVYMEFRDLDNIPYYVPVKLTADNYTFNERANQGLNPLEVEVEVLRTINSQYL